MYTKEENLYKNNLENKASNFVMLYEMMSEYNRLSKDQKRKYSDILTGWLIREKDALNIEDNK